MAPKPLGACLQLILAVVAGSMRRARGCRVATRLNDARDRPVNEAGYGPLRTVPQMRLASRRNEAIAGISTKRHVNHETAMVATSITTIAQNPIHGEPAPKPVAS